MGKTKEATMKKIACVLPFLFPGLLLGAPTWAIDPYETPIADIIAVKDVLDDPSPFYKECDYYKEFMPQEAWDQVTYDIEESKAAWEKAVGFKAKDRVGKVAPEIKPGKYTLGDKEKHPFKELMTPYHYKRWNEPGTEGLPNHIGHFTTFEVIETQQLWHALPVAEATTRNAGKTQLDEDGYIVHRTFEGGYPFPRPSGKHKAWQLVWNWKKRLKDHESNFNYDLTIGVNSRYNIDHRGTAHFLWLRTEGRVMTPPYGWFDKRAEKQGEELIQLYTIFSPRDLYGNVYYITRYADIMKDVNFLAYVNFLRRIRKLSSTDSQDQAVGQDIAFDDADGLSQMLRPDRYPYEVSVIDEREFLVPAYSFDVADYLDSKDKFKWKGLKFERRPMWVVQMKQLDSNYLYSKRIIYFDQETLLPHLWEFYDQKGRYYRTFEELWGVVAPMGYYNAIHVNNCDWIDVHCTWSFSPAYPALWLSRKELSLRSMLKQK
jgi:hypothetical protein